MSERFFPVDNLNASQFVDSRPEWVKGLAGTLSDRDLVRLIEEKEIEIDPLPDLRNDLDTCKIDLHLGNEFARFDYTKLSHIDTKAGIPEDALIRNFVKVDEPIVVPPSELIIAVTMEHISLPDYIYGRLEGKSSIARLGIIIEAAPVFDAGWVGRGAMEIINCGRIPVTLYGGMPICSMNFHLLSSPALKADEHGRYHRQTGPLPSRINEQLSKGNQPI